MLAVQLTFSKPETTTAKPDLATYGLNVTRVTHGPEGLGRVVRLPKRGRTRQLPDTESGRWQRLHQDRGDEVNHGPQRHADPDLPEDLDKITIAAPVTENLPAMRITPQPLLDLKGQAVHPAPHVRRPARDPDARPGWKGDHRG